MSDIPRAGKNRVLRAAGRRWQYAVATGALCVGIGASWLLYGVTCTASPQFALWAGVTGGLLLTGALAGYLLGGAPTKADQHPDGKIADRERTEPSLSAGQTERKTLFDDIAERKRAERQQTNSLRRLDGVNRLQEDLLLPGSLEEKFKKITKAAVGLLDLDFCRIWMVGPGDLCQMGCIHAALSDELHECQHREACLHLMASSGRYTHTNGDHRRVPMGAYKIGRIANGQENKFLTNNATTDPRIHNHQWAASLGLVSFAGYKIRDAHGNPAGVLAAFAQHPLSGEDDAFLSNLAEMTSRVIMDHQVAEELRRTQEQAIEANQAKSRFLAAMSHEIRTPMTAILGYADLLMDPQLNVSSRHNYAIVIRRSGEHLLTLINDILDLSKIEAGKMSLDARRCSVVAILADVASLVRPRAESHGVSFSVEYPGPLPETILTDGGRLRQAIVNLAGNAVKFTERGSVRVAATFVERWRSDRPAVKIEVIDTGIGIREEVLPQLFQPFSQGDAGVYLKYGGTGLGLAISHHIARLLGGDLTATSVWGQGSTFTLTVPTGDLKDIPMLQCPAEVASETAKHVWESTTERLDGIRILLAEDGYDNRELISAVLHRAGAQVETAENGRLAVNRAEHEAFDVILMDMNMPEMDGYEATRLLRDRGYRKPILALTANAMSGDSDPCLAAGCDEYLAKPIDRVLLIRTIAKRVGRETAAGPTTSAPAAAPPPGGDEAIVSQFIDDPDMTEIIRGFVGRLADQLAAMRQSLAGGQHDELRRLAHKLKGAGGSYGYPSLSEACRVLEDAAAGPDHTTAGAALEKVASLIGAIENGCCAGATTEGISR